MLESKSPRTRHATACPLPATHRTRRTTAMNTHDTAELAAHLALYSSQLVRQPTLVTDVALAEYWEASREQQSSWWRAVSLWHSQLTSLEQAAETFPQVRPVVEEMLVSELLTRVWSAIADVHDHAFGAQAYQPIARNILIAHVDLRNRIWALLTADLALPAEVVEQMVKMRKRVERWTDLLLAHLPHPDVVATWAIDAGRMSDFRDDLVDERQALPGSTSADLMIGSLLASLGDVVQEGAAELAGSELTIRISAALSSALDPLRDMEDDLRDLAVARRIDHQADQCEQLLSDLLSLDSLVG